jgi:hydrogenase expression/formation protein HypE
MSEPKIFSMSCPAPVTEAETVLLGHGSGGALMQRLIENVFLKAFPNRYLAAQHDGAVVAMGDERIAFTTDSYVVHPLFFPGGDIGKLAVHGTVNDLAMCGARPLYLSAGFILEEGLPMETLTRVVDSMRAAAEAAQVELVTGDTKVVDRGKADQLFINTAGIGRVEAPGFIAPSAVQPNDGILLNGDIGRHGMAVMAVREGLAFESTIESDTAPLADIVLSLFQASIEVHCLRDATRGGLASVLVEVARSAGRNLYVEEAAIPVPENVRGACEILGLDPLYVANEGRFVAFVAQRDIERALAILHKHPAGLGACLIGHVGEETAGLVSLESVLGPARPLDLLSGEQLPRIC